MPIDRGRRAFLAGTAVMATAGCLSNNTAESAALYNDSETVVDNSPDNVLTDADINIVGVDYDPNSDIIAALDMRGYVRIYDGSDYSLLTVLTDYGDHIASISNNSNILFSPDGSWLAAAYWETPDADQHAVAAVWDTSDWSVRNLAPNLSVNHTAQSEPYNIYTFAWTDDSRALAVAHAGYGVERFRVSDFVREQNIEYTAGIPRSVTIDSTESWVIVGSAEGYINGYDAQAANPAFSDYLGQISDNGNPSMDDDVIPSVQYSPDNNWFALTQWTGLSRSYIGNVAVWDEVDPSTWTENLQAEHRTEPSGSVYGSVWRGDSQRILYGTGSYSSGVVREHSVEPGFPVTTEFVPSGAAVSNAVYGNGETEVVSGCHDNKVYVNTL